ncbi:uncharacterized protein SPSK_02883 [Sporothrix schenckii 1099-18]|uniref:Uncharacterized protein n=1 Tax=Sporothrix schenckii 1099-18 TaxID=1397361 RepID=A0A0F2MBV4_SPOSC|nr:uncharacterized protein SPSK_02883 [Sporothrix schenckii 1099-18]KJR86320.1 hypothetical protein SPSK_02883 [Sporothrix schenckii 1099-18]
MGLDASSYNAVRRTPRQHVSCTNNAVAKDCFSENENTTTLGTRARHERDTQAPQGERSTRWRTTYVRQWHGKTDGE